MNRRSRDSGMQNKRLTASPWAPQRATYAACPTPTIDQISDVGLETADAAADGHLKHDWYVAARGARDLEAGPAEYLDHDHMLSSCQYQRSAAAVGVPAFHDAKYCGAHYCRISVGRLEREVGHQPCHATPLQTSRSPKRDTPHIEDGRC